MPTLISHSAKSLFAIVAALTSLCAYKLQAENNNLPEPYQEVEYIESTGTQYILNVFHRGPSSGYQNSPDRIVKFSLKYYAVNGGAFTGCGDNRTIMGDGTSSPMFFIRYEKSNGNIVLKHKSNGGGNAGYLTLAGDVEGINELDYTWKSNDTSGRKFTLNGTDTLPLIVPPAPPQTRIWHCSAI